MRASGGVCLYAALLDSSSSSRAGDSAKLCSVVTRRKALLSVALFILRSNPVSSAGPRWSTLRHLQLHRFLGFENPASLEIKEDFIMDS
eukprot:1159314-Pelagomonas_calceolata.AAC.2